MNYQQLAEKIAQMSDKEKLQTVYFGEPIEDAGMQYDSLKLIVDKFNYHILVSE